MAVHDTKGYFGDYGRVVTVIPSGTPITGSILITTGSNYYGISGVMVSGSTTGTVTLYANNGDAGGTVSLADLTPGTIYSFGVAQVSASAGKVYLFYRR